MNAIMISEPGRQIRLWLWVEPFQVIVWVIAIINVLVSPIFLLAMHRCARFIMLTRFQHLRACFWYIISCSLNQGTHLDPPSYPHRDQPPDFQTMTSSQSRGQRPRSYHCGTSRLWLSPLATAVTCSLCSPLAGGRYHSRLSRS